MQSPFEQWLEFFGLHLLPDKSSLLLGVGHRVIRLLFQKFAEFVWLRYLAVVRCGSALVWIEPLPCRISSTGQGVVQAERSGPRSPASLSFFFEARRQRPRDGATEEEFCVQSYLGIPPAFYLLQGLNMPPGSRLQGAAHLVLIVKFQ